MKKALAPRNFEDWSHEYSELLVMETNKLIQASVGKDPAKVDRIALLFLAKFIGIMVYNNLMQEPDGTPTKTDRMNFCEANFKAMKRAVGEVVGAGFTSAMQTFSGKDEIEYYAQVKAVPPVTSKLKN